MKIMLTGHKGFIGGHMYRSLIDQGHEVTGYEWNDNYPIITSDIDWVIHIGAISNTMEQDVDKVMKQNYDFSVDLYEMCRKHNVKFQFSSSASVYGLNNEFTETSSVDPKTPYSWSKYMFERYMVNHPIDTTWQAFRYFNVFGPEGEEHKKDQASPHFKFKKQATELDHVKIFKHSESYLRDFIHVSDVIKLQQSFFNVKESGIFNLGTGKTQSFLDVAKKYSDNIIEIEMPKQMLNSYQKYTCADMKKTMNILEKAEVE